MTEVSGSVCHRRIIGIRGGNHLRITGGPIDSDRSTQPVGILAAMKEIAQQEMISAAVVNIAEKIA